MCFQVSRAVHHFAPGALSAWPRFALGTDCWVVFYDQPASELLQEQAMTCSLFRPQYSASHMAGSE